MKKLMDMFSHQEINEEKTSLFDQFGLILKSICYVVIRSGDNYAAYRTPLRNPLLMLLDRLKQGRGPIVVSTSAAVLFVITASLLFNINRIQDRSEEGNGANQTDQYFVETGSIAVRCVRKDYMGHVSKATGAIAVDVAVIEVGLGGTGDSTNVSNQPVFLSETLLPRSIGVLR